MWRELWWVMAGGTISEYERIKSIPVLEFWKLYDLWKARNEAERDALNKRKNAQHGKRG